MNGIESLNNLRVLYMSNNLVSKWPEVARLAVLPYLEELLMQVTVHAFISLQGL